MSRSLKGKVNKLENCVLPKLELGSSKLDITELPEAEQKLYETAHIIADKLEHLENYEPNLAEKKIMDTVNLRIMMRVFDLFTSYLEAALSQGDSVCKVLIHERFLWFMYELREEIRQNLEVSEIEKNAPIDSEVDLVDEYFRKSKPVFTEESYDNLTTELTLEMIKANPERFKQLTEEAEKRVEEKRKQSSKKD